MAKKFSLLMAAVAVLAIAIPAMANAGTVTSSAGTLAPVGTVITGTSTNAETTTSLGTLKCASVTVKGKLTANSGTTVTATNEGVGTTSGCKVGENELTITEPKLVSLSSTTSGSGTVGLSFIGDLPGGVKCTYTGSAVPFTYTVGSSSIKLNGKLKPSPAACGTEAGTTFKGDFALTIGSTAVILD